MRGLLWAIALLYLTTGLALWLGQTRLMFFPSAQLEATPADVQLAYEEVWLSVHGGRVHGWWIAPPSDSAPVILYLHGNGSNLGDLVHRAQRFHQLGYGVFLFDYRGYGRSSGPFPNEERVYEDAEAAWDYVLNQRAIAPDRIFLYGRSIGGAIALYLAHQHPQAAGVVVESSFTTMDAMVKRQLLPRLFPVRWMLNQRFDSLSRVRSLQMPLLLIHGTADTTVPATMSQQLYEAATYPRYLVWIEGAGHSSVPEVGGACYVEAIRSFVEQYRFTLPGGMTAAQRPPVEPGPLPQSCPASLQ